MKIGWLADSGDMGGAELTQAEFRARAPKHVEVIDCPPGDVKPSLDVYVVHNHMTYHPEDLWLDGRLVRYFHDMRPQLSPDTDVDIFCSPLQRDRFGANGGSEVIPPPVNLEPFRDAAESAQERAGAVSVASWANQGKAPHLVAEWGDVDFFGGGVFAPPGSQPVAYEDMPTLLARYETFVFLPTAVEPFGRLVAEAHAAGCEVVTNGLVGARWWLENDPDAIDTAADRFWEVVLG